jgi:hypothetical protein
MSVPFQGQIELFFTFVSELGSLNQDLILDPDPNNLLYSI